MTSLHTPAGVLGALLATLQRPASRPATRVGILNTGELVLVDGSDCAQVLSAATTALIREQLIHTDLAASELLLFPPQAGNGGAA